MSDTPAAAPQVTGKMFLFARPVLLNPTQHADLGVDPQERPFDFAANTRALPLTASEIPAACHDYPIVFASMDQPVPLAVVGIIDDRNLFVDDNGKWEKIAYIPGYVRRYPFGAAYDPENDRFAVVLDADYPGLRPGGENRLFENGETTQFTQEAVDFTRNYENDRKMTDALGQLLKKFDLLAPQAGKYTPRAGGEPIPFAEYVGVDEKKLNELDDEKFMELRKSGALPLVYAQLLSMGNWRRIFSRRADRFNLTEENAFKPLVTS
ncbi:MAG: SapC family protein [Pseudomonadota bacterium]